MQESRSTASVVVERERGGVPGADYSSSCSGHACFIRAQVLHFVIMISSATAFATANCTLSLIHQPSFLTRSLSSPISRLSPRLPTNMYGRPLLLNPSRPSSLSFPSPPLFRRRRHGRRRRLAAFLGGAGLPDHHGARVRVPELVDGGGGVPEQPVDGPAGLVVAQEVLKVEELTRDFEGEPHPSVPRPPSGVDLAVPVLLRIPAACGGGGRWLLLRRRRLRLRLMLRLRMLLRDRVGGDHVCGGSDEVEVWIE